MMKRAFFVAALAAWLGGCRCQGPDPEPEDLCDPDPCSGHGTCVDGDCTCDARYAGTACDACADPSTTYPGCEADDPCDPDPCNGHGTCDAGTCTCDALHTGAACDACLDATATYPGCAPDDPCDPDPCNGHGTCDAGTCTCDALHAGAACDDCASGLVGYPACVECVVDDDCDDPDAPACDPDEDVCVECNAAAQPPADRCVGVCSLLTPECVDGAWECDGPGYEIVEESCDGFDNDCDGLVDEGACDDCDVPLAAIQANLYSMWDIDFDHECNAYLTTLISGGDYTTVIAADGTVTSYGGNSNQDMGFALVDPDPDGHRVVVTYACLFGCNATNGLTLLYTCDDDVDPSCGCAGGPCPGFLAAPFLPTGPEATSLTYGRYTVGTPTGLAAGPGNTYYAGNFRPLTCDTTASCVPCDPDHPGTVCSPSAPACCDTTALGRLATFTLPAPGVEPTFRIVRILAGEQIFGLSSARDGSVWVGTYDAGAGNLYRYDPVADVLTLVEDFDGAVFSVTQDRATGDFYAELRTSPKIVRFDEHGAPLPLPTDVPTDPPGSGVIQAGPDGVLYRIVGATDSHASLYTYALR